MDEATDPIQDDATSIDEDCVQPRRRTSKRALASFLLPMPLWLLAFAALAYWRAQPPPLSGFAGVGWFFGMVGLLGSLFLLTIVLAPISLVLGLIALRLIYLNPDELRGRLLARIGILLSVGMVVLVVAGKLKLQRVVAASQPTAVQRAEAERQYATTARVNRLVEACRGYAYKYGTYPPDDAALYDWIASTERGLERCLPDFVYCGAGLVNDDVAAPETLEQMHDNGKLLVFVQRQSRDRQRLVGFKGSSHRGGGAMPMPDDYLARAFADCNEVRSRLELPPVDFDRLLAAPITRPAPQPLNLDPHPAY